MGLFCVNFQFRTTDAKVLSDALTRRGIRQFRVVPGKGGWTALYEEEASQQDDGRIRHLAGGLSGDLHLPAVAFLVHDSDIACYWLFDNGELLDEYNSDPGYFDGDDERAAPSGGRADVLLRYCRTGVKQKDLEKTLSEKSVRATTFAEDVIRRLAKALGIDGNLATADYRDMAGGGVPGGPDDEDDDDFEDGGAGGTALHAGLVERLAKQFGLHTGESAADPQVTALVQAAAHGDTNEIDRLLAAGADVNGQAPAPVGGASSVPGLAQMFPGGVPQIVMTPLHAAVGNKQRAAAERLLAAGANPNLVHAQYGTPVHAAAAGGDAELLQLLIERGGDVNARNAQGLTPLQAVTANRTAMDRLVQMKKQLKAAGMNLPKGLANLTLPTEGWDACERLLKERGAM